MAEATLNDLNATLKEINKGIKDSTGESATSRAKIAEQAAERKTYDESVLGTLKDIQKTLRKNFKSLWIYISINFSKYRIFIIIII